MCRTLLSKVEGAVVLPPPPLLTGPASPTPYAPTAAAPPPSCHRASKPRPKPKLSYARALTLTLAAEDAVEEGC